MVKQRETLAVLVGVLALAATLRADMMPVSPQDVPCPQASRAHLASDQPCVRLSEAYADLHSLLVQPSPDWEGIVEQVGGTPSIRILPDRQSSFSLCLYTLIGLGLFRSAPLVKKLSFGCIPSWYHDGGPAQIGHSLAISPDCLCAAPVCFVQPGGTTHDLPPTYDGSILSPLLRKSVFTPTVLASRGPPFSIH